ncbi:S9 family peptidase [Arachidicoccus terrestris]|uniref:S9 family peptidase n=1 Tax=Arachidicoccus terrestris TaxID=2875539 RepID=UPI001CC4B64C|nr:S9 family peptidase [Arachidicoccus terrestris]UAY56412.1 S9 family peptidase [Arachidicoccus terrestris]
MKRIKYLIIWCFACVWTVVQAQPYVTKYKWSKDGNQYYTIQSGEIVRVNMPDQTTTTLLTKADLTTQSMHRQVQPEDFSISEDGNKVLIYTNTKKVWRYHTRGDYWVYDISSKALTQLGKGLPESSLMFAKFSPDGKKAAYSSGHNLYVEDLTSHKITPLTKDGTDRIINGTFDWVYEEEFGARDGFRWSADSKKIAFWQVDARNIRNFLMINNTDSIYPFTVPVEYPVVGQTPSAVKIGVVDIDNGKINWMQIPGDSKEHYLPRMEWASNDQIVVQQLDRKQQVSTLYLANASNGVAHSFYKEQSDTWIDIKSRWHGDNPIGWDFIEQGKAFLWVTEKDGWRHIYRVDMEGHEKLVTKGDYDILDLLTVNEQEGYVYFMASPDNATQKYLYRTKLDGSGRAERISPMNEQGTHAYNISPNGKYAEHSFSNANTFPIKDWVALPSNKVIGNKAIARTLPPDFPKVKYIKITTDEGVTMDASLTLPTGFDSTKKYPVVFYVYTEPGSCTVKDSWGNGRNFLYQGDMQKDGYIYISIDGRGTPAPKGARWRHSIYKKVGILNIHDQYEAAKKVVQWPFVDKDRVAVWGWSGGGSTTLNLMFQHPDVYKTGIAVAAVANFLTYDNVYQERYMGLPSDPDNTYKSASPLSHADGLQGNLLLIHGSGDDNVHYQNAEMLINELIKHDKIFSFMEFPNRTHSISEGEGTSKFLSHLYTHYLQEHCPPGAK